MFTFIAWLMHPKTLYVDSSTTYEALRAFLKGPDYGFTVVTDTLILIGLVLLVFMYNSFKKKQEASSKTEG